MPQDAGRNDLCPCGSGKKLKHCHPNGYGKTSSNRNLIIIGVAVAVVAVGAVAMLRDDPVAQRQAAPGRAMPAAPVTNAAMPASQGAGTPQPGPAPPGKVWSPEHGHWHDAPAGGAAANQSVQIAPGQGQQIQMPSPQANRPNTPQPPGPAPEGKVWSPEHGHWHDAPRTTAQPPQPVAQPAAKPAPGSGP